MCIFALVFMLSLAQYVASMTQNFNLNCELGRAFVWLTRNGIGRKFGTLPIGWYQLHQCAALDYLAEQLASAQLPKDAPLRVKLGNVQARTAQGWKTLCSA